jgi:fatty-acyl-CoA synthase
MLGLSLNSTYVLQGKFDPRDPPAVEEHQATALVVVPVMMQRILQLPEETLAEYNLPSLRVTAASGSALPGPLAVKWMDHFGDNLYNLYGSTEVAWATIASPEDMRGPAPPASRPGVVRIVASRGASAEGETGQVFVGNDMAFEVTPAAGQGRVPGPALVGDVATSTSGPVRRGPGDEMIVSGGENVFPQEVEDCIARHDAVVDVAALGVDDADFGKRLRAFVVLSSPDAVTEDELKDHVKRNLARYKVPREIVFVEELPRNATGKILKRELACRFRFAARGTRRPWAPYLGPPPPGVAVAGRR